MLQEILSSRCQPTSSTISLPSFIHILNLFGSSNGPPTTVDLFSEEKEESITSQELHLPWPLHSQGLIDRQECLFLWVTTSTRACAQDLPTEKLLLSFQTMYRFFPPLLCSGRSTHMGLKVYTLIYPTNPTLFPLRSLPFPNELHAPARGQQRELEVSQSSRGHHIDSCYSDRDSAGWAKNKYTISLTKRRSAWSLKTIFKMHGGTDGSAWADITNGRWMRYFICTFRWFLSCFITSLGPCVRKNYVRIFWCPMWGRFNPFLFFFFFFSFWHS